MASRVVRGACPHDCPDTCAMHPSAAVARGVHDGNEVRVFNDRGSFVCAARVSHDARPGVVVAPMGWWNADYPAGRSGQATTSQRLTELGNAPTFNDNRVEVAPCRKHPARPGARGPTFT